MTNGEGVGRILPAARSAAGGQRPLRQRLGGAAAAAVLVLAGGGCATVPPPPGPWQPVGDPVQDASVQLERAEPRDRVLWEYRLGLAALRSGDLELARMSLDAAISRIGGIQTEDAGTRRARSVFGAESEKTFIGEPYERVMAFYYRAILYWLDGEPDNARACYRTGQVIDTDPENQKTGSDWVLLDYLDGLATARLGGDGGDAWKRANAHAKRGVALPPYDPSANVLVFAEFGRGPRKVAAGENGERLRFQERPSAVRGLRVNVGGASVELRPWDDLHFQATTRGGRVMDHILGNKAVFKETTDTVGDAAVLGGLAVLSGDDKSEGRRNLGAGLIAAGVLSKVLSAATVPRADTREWDTLPRHLSFAQMRVAPGLHDVDVEWLDAGDAPAGAADRMTVEVREDGPAVIFLSRPR